MYNTHTNYSRDKYNHGGQKETPRSLKMKETHNLKVQAKRKLLDEHTKNGTLTKDILAQIYGHKK